MNRECELKWTHRRTWCGRFWYTSVKRDLCESKHTYKRDLFKLQETWGGRFWYPGTVGQSDFSHMDTQVSKETHVNQKRPTKETNPNKKRPTKETWGGRCWYPGPLGVKRDLCESKETYKRDQSKWKETHKRDLRWSFLMPWPSWPKWLRPHEYTSPEYVDTIIKSAPTDTNDACVRWSNACSNALVLI